MNVQNSHKKTIKISPELFKVPTSSSSKQTRKNGVPPRKPVSSLVRPSVLKQSLLKKIKEHKHRETQKIRDKNNASIKISQEGVNEVSGELGKDIIQFSDDFNDSMKYLKDLSLKNNLENRIASQLAQPSIPSAVVVGGQSATAKPTLSEAVPLSGTLIPVVQPLAYAGAQAKAEAIPIDLGIPKEFSQNNDDNEEIFDLKNYDPNAKEPAYGCLKGGTKPTYREWLNKNQIQNQVHKQNVSLNSQPTYISSSSSSSLLTHKDQKLLGVKQQWERNKQNMQAGNAVNTEPLLAVKELSISKENPDPIQLKVEEKVPTSSSSSMSTSSLMSTLSSTSSLTSTASSIPSISTSSLTSSNNNQGGSSVKTAPSVQEEKTYEKKITRQKWRLGKSAKLRTVGVLLKDNATRKNIIKAHKDLAKESIHEIKKYLRNKGLIKGGSCAPNRVIREIYESSKLTGDVMNNNKETLMENLMNES